MKGRRFACFPAAVLVFIVDAQERILLLAHPHRGGAWEVPNGAVDAGESILEAVVRETREEAGADVVIRPLGALHAYGFRYDEAVTSMISIAYLLAYVGGQVEPGDDMRGSAFRWWSLDEIERERPRILRPAEPWLLERAVTLHRLWQSSALPPMAEGSRH